MSSSPSSPLALRHPKDSPDLAYLMAAVTAVGGASSWISRSTTHYPGAGFKTAGAVAGLTMATVFGLGGWVIEHNNKERGDHELAHQSCMIASVLFTGAMSYRAGSNALLGPGSTMLAALGGASSSYHLFKMLQWRSYKQHRVEMIEKGWWSGGGTMKETERWMNDGDGGAEPRSD